ncbi:MAG: hypothetical protein JWL63_1538 [Rhodocyclales bacterium]|nr:hypothetical protein [Rhodocyclales bacterium]
MQTQTDVDVFDLQGSVSKGQPVRDHGPYRVSFGNEVLEYHPAVIDDPVPTGRQLLEAAGVRPVIDFTVFQVLNNGMLEQLRQDETTDLRSSGVEKFLIFRSDASYRFVLDDREFEWGAKFITGLTLKKLAGVDLTTYGVWQETRGAGEDRPIGDAELIDMSKPGVERFFTGLKSTTEG